MFPIPKHLSCKTLCQAAATALCLLAGSSQAALVNGADVGGFRTFVDTSTGTVWADLDNHLELTQTGYTFRFTDRNDYLAALIAAGFTWATTAEVAALTASAPMVNLPQDFVDIGHIVGSLSFGETTTIDAMANAGNSAVQRHYATAAGGWQAATPTGYPTALNDSGLWAHLAPAPGPGGGEVPAPASLALAGLGLAALGGARVRPRRGVQS